MNEQVASNAAAPRDGIPERSGGIPSRHVEPDPQVAERAKRRTFTAEYKERIVREAERCRGSGAIGALLRREGLYSSHLDAWRKQLRAHVIETGARWSELTLTTWADVRWTPGELRLRSETTKNRTERVIPLGATLLDLLRERARRDAGDGEPQPAGLVFRSPWGHAWGLSHNFRDWLDEMLEAADITRKDAQGRVVNVHALRHTFATRLARAGVPLQQAACLTGHRTLAVLMQIYTHLQAEDTRAAITRLALPAIERGNIRPIPQVPQSKAPRAQRRKSASRSSLGVVGRTGFEPVTSTL